VDVRMETGDRNEHRVCVYTAPLRREPPKANKQHLNKP
jgi:hypothetical protein